MAGDKWNGRGGFREVLKIALPLVVSSGSWSVQHFVDRMFLTWYSPESIAAAMPAGMLSFTITSIFIGTASYVSTFVAQYFGAQRNTRVGPALWQGIYVALIGGLIVAATIPFADSIFGMFGHPEKIRAEEAVYFQYLNLGAAPVIAAAALSAFFSGLGRTMIVMWVNVAMTAINIVFDYIFIFGNLGAPEMGIKGAAIATVIAQIFNFIAYFVIIVKPSYNREFHTLKGWMFEKELFARLVRFGVPSGVQFFLDMLGFTAFIMIMGRLGTIPLAATNIAFNINTIAFMPMIGFGIAISVLVGQYLGRGRPDIAQRSVYSGFIMTFGYMSAIALMYVVFPEIFIAPFAVRSDPEYFARIRELTLVLLKFVAVYSVFDTMNIIFASAIKGAGDTRFVMYMIVLVSALVLVVPSYVAIVVFGYGIMAGWTAASLYVIVLGFVFLFRFLSGKWKTMRVIEEQAPVAVMCPERPECPAIELES
ncbi:MAG TPA: MATE family efflux transporter [Deltaproteobacteria bacterium]|nr:MATE family efflux transporter [Deltaproteobacteria bacterium]